MIIRKSLISTLAVAVMLAFTGVPALNAASVAGAGTGVKVAAETSIEAVKGKKKAKKKGKKKAKAKKRGKKKASKAGRCGAYMYYSKKGKKCMDARNKK
jgi:hypothetical protein